MQETLNGLRIRLVQPGRSTGEFLVIGRRLGHHEAGRVVETAKGEEEGSQQHSRHISISGTRGQERSSVWLSASKMHFLPQAKESPLHYTPSKPPPKCTKCCSICGKRKLTKSSVSSLELNCNLLDRSRREFLSRAKKIRQINPIRHILKRGAESSFPGFSPTRRLGTVVFLRFKNDRSSYTIKFRK